MNKKEIKAALKMANDGAEFINISQIARALNRSRDSARNLVYGLEYLPSGRNKNYFIDDVAERILAAKVS